MRLSRNRRLAAHICSLIILLSVVGCGGSDGGGPDPEPDCEIATVNTGLVTSYLTGEAVEIRWTGNGVPSTVQIELLKAGAVVATIAEGTANDGFHAWTAATAGQPNGADFGIRVTGTGETACSAEMTGLTITDVSGCSLAVTPISAEDDTVTAGVQFTLTWDSFHTSGNVDIELYKSLPSSLGDFVGTVAFEAPDTGSYTWTVDSFHAGTLRYRYRVADSVVDGCEGISTPFFMIDDELCAIQVFGPNAGQTYNEGAVMQIDVDQDFGSGAVNLRLYSGETFVTGGFIAEDVDVLGDPVMWTINDYGWTLGNSSYKIKAFDVADDYCVGESGRFAINGK